MLDTGTRLKNEVDKLKDNLEKLRINTVKTIEANKQLRIQLNEANDVAEYYSTRLITGRTATDYLNKWEKSPMH